MLIVVMMELMLVINDGDADGDDDGTDIGD
jgi:hypothetical protein